MEFFIKKNATEPILKMKFVNDDQKSLNEFTERLTNAKITFTMSKDGEYKIYKHSCSFIVKENNTTFSAPDYLIYYEWTEADTDETGIYDGVFNITFYSADAEKESVLILPIKEKLYINIL